MDLSSEEVENIKQQYPEGTRLKLIDMNDLYPVPPGTEGTVRFVDSAGQIHMDWDNGRTLPIQPEHDTFEVI